MVSVVVEDTGYRYRRVKSWIRFLGRQIGRSR